MVKAILLDRFTLLSRWLLPEIVKNVDDEDPVRWQGRADPWGADAGAVGGSLTRRRRLILRLPGGACLQRRL